MSSRLSFSDKKAVYVSVQLYAISNSIIIYKGIEKGE